jgi:predicted permease
VPLTGINDQGIVRIEGRAEGSPDDDGAVGNRPHVSSRYFETMGIPLAQGRLFDEWDGEDSAPVAIVSERAARTWWPGHSALGKRVAVNVVDDRWEWREVVGVVRSTRHFGLEAPEKPEVYVPYRQHPSPIMAVVVRGRTDAETLIPEVARSIAAVDPEQAAILFQSMDELLSTAGAHRRFVTSLSTGFAGLALLPAALGVYGVMAFTVACRTREIGVRLALGGRPPEIVRAVLGRAMRVSLAGTAVGVAGAVALSGLPTRLLFGVSALDAPTFAGATALLLAASAAAAWIPGRGAARISPLVALRED